MHGISGEKSAMEGAGSSQHKARKLLAFGQAFEEGIEIISWKIIQVDLSFRRLAVQFSAFLRDAPHDGGDDDVGVWASRAAQVRGVENLGELEVFGEEGINGFLE